MFYQLLILLILSPMAISGELTEEQFKSLGHKFTYPVFEVQLFVDEAQEIIRPPLAWKLISEMRTYGFDGGFGNRLCLFYRTPTLKMANFKKDDQGKLAWLEVSDEKSCPTQYKEQSDWFGNIRSLNIFLNTQKSKLTISYLSLATKKRSNLEFPLYNISQMKGELKRYDRFPFQSLSPGLILLGQTKPIEIKKLEDSNFETKKITYCQKFNEKCEEIINWNCDSCAGGWFEVIDSGCQTKTSKVCGVNRCGEKNWPACLRGWQYTETQSSYYCETGSKVGFCQDNLDVVCDNGLLVCL